MSWIPEGFIDYAVDVLKTEGTLSDVDLYLLIFKFRQIKEGEKHGSVVGAEFLKHKDVERLSNGQYRLKKPVEPPAKPPVEPPVKPPAEPPKEPAKPPAEPPKVKALKRKAE
jgi:hypothetical protein